MAIMSFIVAVAAALIAGVAVFFVLNGGLRAKSQKSVSWQEESLVDRFGVLCFRIIYRFLISTIGGALMIALLAKPKPRQNA